MKTQVPQQESTVADLSARCFQHLEFQENNVFMWALGREPRASFMLGQCSVAELEPLSCPQMNFYCLKKKRTRSSKLKSPQDSALFRAKSSKPCRLQTKSRLHIKITGVTIKNKMEYVTVKLAWDLAERRIKQTQSIQRQQQRNRKVPALLGVLT